jgi:hypothetical protein
MVALQSLGEGRQNMSESVTFNVLYFVVMPQISLSPDTYGRVDEVLTLLPDKGMASEFSEGDVDSYILLFKHRVKYFIGDDVIGYSFEKERMQTGRYVVKVTQNVA